MTTQVAQSKHIERLREILDWTVLSLGILSLSIAIGATVLEQTKTVNSDSGQQGNPQQSSG